MASVWSRPWGKGAAVCAVAGLALLGQPAAAQDGMPFSAPWISQPDNAAVAGPEENGADADMPVAAYFRSSGQPFHKIADRRFAKSRTAGAVWS